MAVVTRFLRRMKKVLDAASRVYRAVATAFVLMAVAFLAPLFMMTRRVDVSHGIPMPGRAAGGAP